MYRITPGGEIDAALDAIAERLNDDQAEPLAPQLLVVIDALADEEAVMAALGLRTWSHLRGITLDDLFDEPERARAIWYGGLADA